MRITGGEFCARILKAPKGLDVRPTQDRVREALFSMLTGAIEGAEFLDLFAGTGAVGIEALSRGAKKVHLVEKDRRAARTISENFAQFKIAAERFTLENTDVNHWLARNEKSAAFDIVFADPPYALELPEVGGVVKNGGLFIAEVAEESRVALDADFWELLRDRRYGRTRILIWRKIEKSAANQ